MKNSSFHILRVAMAITFLWIGILIFKNPASWGAFVQPWVVKLLPFSLKEVMVSTALLDMAIGFLLLVDFLTPLAAFFAALHLLIVLSVSGINAITVRDIGLLGGSLALFFSSFSWGDFKSLLRKLKLTRSS
jgi:uncharacterized membrane protein YphA (DoxX/SURF4 family)